MRVVDLADELGLTTASLLDLCDRAGVSVAGGGDELTEAQVGRLRALHVAPPPPAPPPPPPSAPGSVFTADDRSPPPSHFGPATSPRRLEPLALASFVTSFLCGPFAWLCAYLALRSIKRSSGRRSGRWLVYAGLPFSFISALALLGAVIGEEQNPTTGRPADLREDDDNQDNVLTAAERTDVGECFQMPEDRIIQLLDTLTCDRPHDAEIYAIVQNPDGPGVEFPGNDALLIYATAACGDAFEPFIGIPIAESTLEYSIIHPTHDSWVQADDRAIICAVRDPAGPTTGSLEGAGR